MPLKWTPSTYGEAYRLRLGTPYTWAAVWLEAPRPGRNPRWRASVIGKTLDVRFDSAEQAQRAAERELEAALAQVKGIRWRSVSRRNS